MKKVTFKENTFVKGTPDELKELAKKIEAKGAEFNWGSFTDKVNHLWWFDLENYWTFSSSLYRSCHHELTHYELLEAYEIYEPDFSILNETDVFFLELKGGYNWLYQGNNLYEDGYGVHVSLVTNSVYKKRLLTKKEDTKLIRLATPEEIAPYAEHFKIETMKKEPKFKVGDTVRCVGESNKNQVNFGPSAGWKKDKEFIVDRIEGTLENIYFPEKGHGVCESQLELVETDKRPIEITKETAREWLQSGNGTLKKLALQAFPELDEEIPKIGDLCLFSDNKENIESISCIIGTLEGITEDGRFNRKDGRLWKYCRKIKTLELV